MLQFRFQLRLFVLVAVYLCLPELPVVTGAFSPRQKFQDLRRSRRSVKFQDLLKTRRTVNDFEPVLPKGWDFYLKDAVEAATFAPNHKRTEPWRFHLLGAESIQRVCELNAEMVSAKKGAKAGEKKLERWLAMPGWLVVTQVIDTVASDDHSDDDSWKDPTSVTREDYAACCCAVQNLCLSLHANGISTKWTTGPVNFDERFAAAVGLSDSEAVVGTIWFGKAATKPLPPKKRLSLDEVFLKHS
jgi:nitroreductase